MLRKKGGIFREKYFEYNEYYAYNEGNIVVLLR
jgi:hypothetical protein